MNEINGIEKITVLARKIQMVLCDSEISFSEMKSTIMEIAEEIEEISESN